MHPNRPQLSWLLKAMIHSVMKKPLETFQKGKRSFPSLEHNAIIIQSGLTCPRRTDTVCKPAELSRQISIFFRPSPSIYGLLMLCKCHDDVQNRTVSHYSCHPFCTRVANITYSCHIAVPFAVTFANVFAVRPPYRVNDTVTSVIKFSLT